MNGSFWLKIMAAAFIVLLAACAAGDDSPEKPAIAGPALIMWYTDN